MNPMSGCDIRRVYITAQRQYTAVQKMRKSLKKLSMHYIGGLPVECDIEVEGRRDDAEGLGCISFFITAFTIILVTPRQ